MTLAEPRDPAAVVACLRDARARTLSLVADLDDRQLEVPRLEIVNPLRWEIGHVAWFQEKWIRRWLHGEASLQPRADELFDSSEVFHDTRWNLALPTRAEVLAYMRDVLDDTAARVGARQRLDPDELYFLLLVLFHEDMHGEALVYTRQTLGYRAPAIEGAAVIEGGGPLPGDVPVPGGRALIGARPGRGFAFDNEQSAHPVEVAPFRIARAAVTQAEYRDFVDDRGYERRELWSEAGWRWREGERARHPVYWRRDAVGWRRRHFDRWVALEPHLPVHHVNAFEAEAYCRWAGRRLPSEAEWEVAAGPGRHPWGDADPRPEHAHLDLRTAVVADVGAYPAGDSPSGCRQMTGNVWEWTATPFGPYPGFEPGPYRDYSAPWFGTRRVLRGGAYATRSRLLRNTWRNFFPPERRDVLAGFRTVALEG